jgi:hypothetical protein
MSIFTENPTAIAIIGGLTLAIIAGGWYQTQRRELLVALFAALVLFMGLLALERSIVTDSEQVQATIRQIAREAEADNVAALERHFHSSASHYRDQLRGAFALYQLHKVSVKNNLKVTVDRKQQPPSAVATFNVVVVGSDRTGTIKNVTYPRFVTAHFLLEDGEWKCVDYKDEEPQTGMQIHE